MLYANDVWDCRHTWPRKMIKKLLQSAQPKLWVAVLCMNYDRLTRIKWIKSSTGMTSILFLFHNICFSKSFSTCLPRWSTYTWNINWYQGYFILSEQKTSANLRLIKENVTSPLTPELSTLLFLILVLFGVWLLNCLFQQCRFPAKTTVTLLSIISKLNWR